MGRMKRIWFNYNILPNAEANELMKVIAIGQAVVNPKVDWLSRFDVEDLKD